MPAGRRGPKAAAGPSSDIALYGRAGLNIYEKVHYSRDEHGEEVRQILGWLPAGTERLLDIGCSAGLHALEFARTGYSVVGVDIERFAIDRARRRSRRENVPARFRVADITRDDLSDLGTFDFIYSLGNVLSHIPKAKVPGILRNIRSRLADGGVFLVDFLITGGPFRTRIRDEYHRIFWERRLDEATGRIMMDGYFVDYDLTQRFDVWGYTVEEALGRLETAGFRSDGVSGRLDFSTAADEESNPFCLNFRSRPGGS